MSIRTRRKPIGEDDRVWLAACALADHRHADSPTPTLADLEDARIVVRAIEAHVAAALHG